MFWLLLIGGGLFVLFLVTVLSAYVFSAMGPAEGPPAQSEKTIPEARVIRR